MCGPTVDPQHLVCQPPFVAATPDLGHVVLESTSDLLSGVPGASGNDIYEWAGGRLERIGAVQFGEADFHAISTEGSRIVFEAGLQISEKALYVRDIAKGQTIELDKAEANCEEVEKECESGGGSFQIASTDGARVLFTDPHRLTSDAGQASKADLYECEVVSGAGGKDECRLSDLTPKAGGESADVQGGVLGASEDGSYVYFVAMGVQSEAPNDGGQSPVAGQPNLYLSHDGAITFIVTLSGVDEHDWEVVPAQQPARVSSNGRWLSFMSQAALGGV